MSGSNLPIPTIALLASPSRLQEMVDWIVLNAASLGGCALLVSPHELAARLENAQKLALDNRLLSLRIQTPPHPEHPDVAVAAQILDGAIKGVVCFDDTEPQQLLLLARVCRTRNIPLALNPASADLCLRGVAKTRVVYLIFNPVAGQGDSERDLQIIRDVLEPTMILHVVFTEKDRDVAEQAKELVDLIQAAASSALESTPMIVASGGDGTVSAVAGATLNTGIPFGAIPRGTANAFSVALGIPTPPHTEEAARTILLGHVRTIDGALCNDTTPFVNLAGVGFEAGLVSNATRELKNALGNLAYVLGGAQQALQQEPFRCEIQVDEEEKRTIETKVITVANVAPSSSVFAQGFGEIVPDDGLLEVTIGTGSGLGELEGLASLWAASVVKKPVPTDNVLRIRAKTITVDCNPPQKLLLDGEVLEMNPVTFRVVPNGLNVVVPVEKAAK